MPAQSIELDPEQPWRHQVIKAVRQLLQEHSEINAAYHSNISASVVRNLDVIEDFMIADTIPFPTPTAIEIRDLFASNGTDYKIISVVWRGCTTLRPEEHGSSQEMTVRYDCVRAYNHAPPSGIGSYLTPHAEEVSISMTGRRTRVYPITDAVSVGTLLREYLDRTQQTRLTLDPKDVFYSVRELREQIPPGQGSVFWEFLLLTLKQLDPVHVNDALRRISEMENQPTQPPKHG